MAVQPDWDDPDTFEAARQEILAYGLRNGLTMELLFSLTDPEEVSALGEAAKGDRDRFHSGQDY